MLRKLEEQEKTIQYMRNKYKEKTGQQIVMPKSWQDYLDVQIQDTPLIPLPQTLSQKTKPQQSQSFQLAIDKLNLPSRLNATKIPLTSFIPSNKYHMIENICLNNFKNKGFTKQLFRQFLGRIVQMRCLHTISLKNNGIDDTCTQQVESLFNMKRIIRIDLSLNKLGKISLQIICKSFQHLQWIDLSRNDFLWETATLTTLLNAIRQNSRLYHIGLDLQDPKQMNILTSFLKIKPHIHSFSPIDSKIDNESMNHICSVLESNSFKKDQIVPRLNYLNLNFCYLQGNIFRNFLKSLLSNNTLIYLELGSNNLGDQLANALNIVLQSNICLIYVGLSNNYLQDQFGKQLSVTLIKNQILQIVDVSRNNIGDVGAKDIYQSLSQKNDTLEGLGDITTNGRISKQYQQNIAKALRINRISKQIRAKILKQQSQLSIVQISNKQTQAFLQAQYRQYELVVPISISNPMRNEPYKLNLWAFD